MNHRDDDGAKTFLDGTHRVVDPATTLAKIKPFAAWMGITRVAVLTGLDVIGIPGRRSRATKFALGRGAPGQGGYTRRGEGLRGDGSRRVLPRREHRLAAAARVVCHVIARHERSRSGNAAVLRRTQLRRRNPAVDRSARPDVHRPLWLPHELVSADFADNSCRILPGCSRPPRMASPPAITGRRQFCTHCTKSWNAMPWRCWRALPERMQDERGLDAACGGWFARPPVAHGVRSSRRRRAPVGRYIGYRAAGFRYCLAAPAAETDAVEPELGSGCHADRDIALSRAFGRGRAGPSDAHLRGARRFRRGWLRCRSNGQRGRTRHGDG